MRDAFRDVTKSIAHRVRSYKKGGEHGPAPCSLPCLQGRTRVESLFVQTTGDGPYPPYSGRPRAPSA